MEEEKMKITLDNYQEYAAEWLDGSLNHELAEAFGRFLADHPVIRDELDEIRFSDTPSMKPGHTPPDFSACKRTTNDKSINAGNFLEFVNARMDGELTEASLAKLDEWLVNHPDRQKEARLFELTLLKPDTTLTWDGKDDLLRMLGTNTVQLNEEHQEEYMVASLEGELSEHDQAKLDTWLRENPSAMLLYRQFEQTMLKPDLSVVFPDKGSLKQRSVVVLFSRRRVLRIVSVAASVALLAGIFLVDRNQELMITHPGGDILLSTTGVLMRPDPKVTGASDAIPVNGQTASSGITRRGSATVSAKEQDVAIIQSASQPLYAVRSETRMAGNIQSSANSDVIVVPERRPLAHSVADASDIAPSRPRRTIDEFPIEQVRYFTGGGNEKPGLLAQLTLPRLIEVANPYERINSAGQVILTRWAEWKGKALDEVLPYR
jgi:hypothetical protein